LAGFFAAAVAAGNVVAGATPRPVPTEPGATGSAAISWQLALAATAHSASCTVARPGHARCYLKTLRASVSIEPSSACSVNESAGWSACNIENAYKLTTLSATKGLHETVAVVDAYDDPDAEADLAIYRSSNGLPSCSSASECFRQVNQEGVSGAPPAGDMGWGGEISLDLDMVSAVCPRCHIILVEANSSGLGDLLSSVAEAVRLGANVVTDSWGSGEFDGETVWDRDLDFPGVPITFSSGDGAYAGGVQYPSASQYVTSVGGTMLVPTTSGRLWKETAWVTKPPKGQQPTQAPAAAAQPGSRSRFGRKTPVARRA